MEIDFVDEPLRSSWRPIVGENISTVLSVRTIESDLHGLSRDS
ncbi:MAG: hypothetical protein ABJA89_00300 [Lapillicoccus sp.]